MTPKTEKLIIKYLTNSATANDLDSLSKWIENPSNRKAFKGYIQAHFAINYSAGNPDTKTAIDRLLSAIHKEKSLIHKIKSQPIYKYGIAASVTLILALTLFLNKESDAPFTEPTIVNTVIEPGTDKATLTLEDGTNVILEKGQQYILDNLESNGEDLVYKPNQTKSNSSISYNYLTIPRGGQYHIKLSDGTEVWLNSESQLKYPKSFIDGEERIVELVYGEVYFDVSPSADHKGAKFKVLNQSQEVEVLGTEFNVKAYKDESHIYTTLVEGKVAIDNGVSIQNLTPNQQLNLNIENNHFTIATVDVKGEISWKDGIFSFIDKPLKDIMKVISRWYDVDVIFENKKLESIEFIGVLEKKQSIEEVLSIIKSNSINDYEITNRTIIIK